MRMRGPAARMVAGVALAAAGRTVAAQPPAGDAPDFRYTVEGYLAQYALDDATNSNKQNVGGFGARVTFNRPTPSSGGRSIFDRITSNLFATYTAKQGTPSSTTLHVGGQADGAVLRSPLGGVLDPFVSVGIGIFRTSRDIVGGPGGSNRITRSDLALTPGVGTRIRFFNGIGARGDLRAPFVFGFRTTANVVAEGGLYVSF